MPVPDFAPGEVLTASAMDSIGLWLVKTQTVGTGVSSVTVTNAFSADYRNYRIVWTGGTCSVNGALRMTLGAAATGYYSQLIYQAFASALNPLANVPDNNAVRWSNVGSGEPNWAFLQMDIYNPQATTRTQMAVQNVWNSLAGYGGGILDNNTSYTDFTITHASGTLTGGTIRVYGYRN